MNGVLCFVASACTAMWSTLALFMRRGSPLIVSTRPPEPLMTLSLTIGVTFSNASCYCNLARECLDAARGSGTPG